MVVVNGQTVPGEKKREDWSCFAFSVLEPKTPGIPLVQWLSLLTTAVMAYNCICDGFSHCLKVQAHEMTVWKNSAQNNACNLGQKCTNASGNMRQSCMHFNITHKIKQVRFTELTPQATKYVALESVSHY